MEVTVIAFDIMKFSGGALQKRTENEIIACNAETRKFGLVLSPTQAAELAETRNFELAQCRRVEFGESVLPKLIKAFCRSPYVSPHTWEETLSRLTAMFYHYKNETDERLTDDCLIEIMYRAFNGSCCGSLDLLEGRELDAVARNLRAGRSPFYNNDEEEADDDVYIGHCKKNID